MFVWIVMWINQMMFSAVSDGTRDALQFVSYIELLIEVVVLAVVIAVAIMDRKGNK